MPVVLDTAIGSRNLGDVIISESVTRLFELDGLARLPTHEFMNRRQRQAARRSDLALFTGTNVIGRNLWLHRQWQLRPDDVLALGHKVVFLGVGWGNPLLDLDPLTRAMLRYLRHPEFPVGARDQNTAERLQQQGVPAQYVACPTMWALPTSIDPPAVPDEVVTTLTDYRQDPQRDTLLLNRLGREYKRVLLWPQGVHDQSYADTLSLPTNLTVLDRTLPAFEEAVRGRPYIGTRLHAGIRTLQLGSRAVVVGVDNRAREISRDTGLPYLDRDGLSRPDDLDAAFETVREASDPTYELPTATIGQWRTRLEPLLAA